MEAQVDQIMPSEILALREKFGWTQRDLARKMGVTQGAIFQWESGKTQPTGPAKRLLRILEKTQKKS